MFFYKRSQLHVEVTLPTRSPSPVTGRCRSSSRRCTAEFREVLRAEIETARRV
jgi:hypothetical protein